MLPYLLLLVLLLVIIGAIGLYLIRKTPFGTLDPKVAIALKLMPERKEGISVTEQRAQMRKMVDKYKKDIPLLRVENQTISIANQSIPIRIYSNSKEENLPILIYYHGGGWVVGDLETHDGICRLLAKSAKVLVVSVAYRLAPEHPYPIPLEDSYNALLWMAENGQTIGGNPQKIAVSGDSAGGNLAAAVALKARDENGPKISYQALIYPVTDLSKLTTTSYENFREGFFLTRDMMAQYIDYYVPVANRKEGYVSPLLVENLLNLPPALVITAGFDPLRDEGEQYGERLKAAGIPTTITRYKGTIHGFFGLEALGKAGVVAIEEVGNQLTAVFNN
ncbi:MAG: alpha/beta hydrolase [Saprospiraceae bacterium]